MDEEKRLLLETDELYEDARNKSENSAKEVSSASSTGKPTTATTTAKRSWSRPSKIFLCLAFGVTLLNLVWGVYGNFKPQSIEQRSLRILKDTPLIG